ncbi:unnamed protein product [Camellia sinensis]
METIPIDEIKKELRSAELSDEAIEELLQVLSIKSLTKLEGKRVKHTSLFWPDQPEFVRMAARFGATIVPFATIGEDDIAEATESDSAKSHASQSPFQRSYPVTEMEGEIAKQDFYFPGLLPKIPGRFYYLFGKPIQTKGKEAMLKDRENAKELYLQIKSEVERNIAFLIKKQEEDPYRGIIERSIYQATSGPIQNIPTFEP